LKKNAICGSAVVLSVSVMMIVLGVAQLVALCSAITEMLEAQFLLS